MISHRCLAGLALGLALLTKLTAFVLFPIELLIVLSYSNGQCRKNLFQQTTIFSIALLVLLCGYQFDLTPLFQSVEFHVKHTVGGHSAFIGGNYSAHGWWYFYLANLLLKNSAAFLILITLALYSAIKFTRVAYQDIAILFIPVVTIISLLCLSDNAIGIRYLLPIYPFLFTLCGSIVYLHDRWKFVVCTLLIWYLAASALTYPDYLTYFSELVGGARNGYKYLVDSNLDWGQDLKGLKKYMETNHVDRISLSYFGADSPSRYGIEYDWLPSYYLVDPTDRNEMRIKPEQLLAISVTNLQGVYFKNKEMYKWLFDYRPVAKIGNSIFIFDLNQPRIQNR
jgi:hypothetical protein